MKKIYMLSILLLMTFSASFSFADERHDTIIAHYKEKHPEVKGIFYTLDALVGVIKNSNNGYPFLRTHEMVFQRVHINNVHSKEKHPEVIGSLYMLDPLVGVNVDLNDTYLVLTAREFAHQRDRINNVVLRCFPNIHIILDVQEGDGLVIDGLFSLNIAPKLMRRFTILNIAQDVRMIDDHFLKDSRELTYLDISSLNQVNEIGRGFLSCCTGLLTLDQLILSTYNPTLRACLELTFPQGSIIGEAIRENYIEGYVSAVKNRKSARN